MDIENKRTDFQDGYVTHHNELIELWNKTIRYQINFEQFVNMLEDFIKDTKKSINEIEGYREITNE